MQRTMVNLLVDLATALALFGMMLTGYVIRFPLPPGTNKEWMLWGLSRHQWGGIHFWVSTVLLALILLHLCLHWRWVVTVVRQRFGLAKPSRYGIIPDALVVGLGLGIVFAGFAWIAHTAIEPVPDSHTGPCPSDSPVQPEPIQGKEPAELNPTWADVYPILERACLSCHGPQKKQANFRVDQPEKWFAIPGNPESPAWIIPWKSEGSLLIEIVSGRRKVAAPSRHRLTDSEVTLLRRWIDSGAVYPQPEKDVLRQKQGRLDRQHFPQKHGHTNTAMLNSS